MKKLFAAFAVAALALGSLTGLFVASAQAAAPCKVAGTSFEYFGGVSHKTLEQGDKDFHLASLAAGGGDVTSRFVLGIVKFNAELIKDYLARGDLSYSERGMSHDPAARTDFIVSKVLADLGCK